MKQLLLYIIFGMLSFFAEMSAADAQSININLKKYNSITFIYNSFNDLSQTKTINNALELEVKVKNRPCYVSAQLTFLGSGNAADNYANKMILRQTSKTSYTASVSNINTILTSAPTQLFSQPASGSAVKTYSFFYDVIMNPITTFVTPGTHNFLLTFTTTQP